ncbi:Gfo/Idh/MocA family protein [Winogradskyella endarachnes]|uniref:Gfo/Idh/MocA family oxidoreductase n=1 Tax=Winogradskyella endarachnes TaxID=2681965 RepID=A0A6L6U8V6_9FLAO|nr:Gfo/Idh/MocA family oxidoreductase [Winogradskyella endarachnes]MUU78735.1 gfo/Idh/MocA family oxidoreductase [Winogradskyella endarachnes]
MKTYHWGIIGCGKVTEVKSGPAYQKTEGFELTAVMRRDAEKAEDYAKRHNVPKFYSDADQLINNPEIDAIYIATPPDTHTFYALKVAKAGKICCIEKPMAPTHHDCLTINAAFKAKNLPLFVAYYRRSLPRFDKIKSWIDADSIGEIRHINWILTKPANAIDTSKAYNWRTDAKIAPAGYFDDLASHGLDLFAYLLGDISKAIGIATNQQGLYSAKDAVTANWLHHSGITGTGSWNFGTEKREDNVEIFGSKGKIKFSVFNEQPIVLENGEKHKSLVIEHPKNIQLYHVQNIKKHLESEFIHPSTGETAAKTAWVMDQILKAD